MWVELVLRAVAGGAIVSVFALMGDVLRPKSFAGLFGAAPSVALASLAITFHTHAAEYVTTEARWMALGALAFGVYASLVCHGLKNGRRPVRPVVVTMLAAWFLVSIGGWWAITRAHLG